jgi:hypothetical protein
MQRGNAQPKVVSFNRKDGIGKELDNALTLNAGDYRGLNRNQDQTAVIDDLRIRRLTPKECERLQAFPDNHTEYGMFTEKLVSYKLNGNIEVWNKAKVQKIKSPNVRFKIVEENKKPASVIASCTISDGNVTEHQTQQISPENQICSVNIAIEKSDQSGHWECVINTTKCSDSTTTLSIWSINAANQDTEGTSEIETDTIPTGVLWRNISDGSSPEMKLSIISIPTKQIIESVISTFALAKSISISIESLPQSSTQESRWRVLDLKTVTMSRISDTERYKMCGNAVTVNVIRDVFERILA